jgi:hypothetical protein
VRTLLEGNLCPGVAQYVVTFDAFAVHVHDGQVFLRLGVAELGQIAVQLERVRKVLLFIGLRGLVYVGPSRGVDHQQAGGQKQGSAMPKVTHIYVLHLRPGSYQRRVGKHLI